MTVCSVTASLITQNVTPFSRAPQHCRIILWIVSFKCLWGYVIQTAVSTALYSQLAHLEEGDLLQ